MRRTFRPSTPSLILYLLIVLVPTLLQAEQRGRGFRGPLGPVAEATPPANMERHDGFVAIAQAGDVDLLFSGDSITDWCAREGDFGRAVWEESFAHHNPANFGIAGDTTQGVLWRVRNGELEGFEARLIVHMLGTNNINRNSNADIVEGNRLIVEEFRQRQPQSKARRKAN